MRAWPSVSIILVTYNSVLFVREAIESAINQTLRPHEIVITDDHSTDGTWEIIQEYASRYPSLVRAYRQKENVGIPKNFNAGFEKVRGDWVTFNAGDDRLCPEMLEKQVRALQDHKDAQVVYSNVYTINEEGKRTNRYHDDRAGRPPEGDTLVEVFSRRFFSNSGSLFRNELISTSAFREIGGYDEDLESYEDWDLKIRLAARFKMAYSGEPLVEYRLRRGGFSRRDPDRHFRAAIAVYEKNVPLLVGREHVDEVLVRCRVETFLALKSRSRNQSSNTPHYSAQNVFERNSTLVQGLPVFQRERMKRMLSRQFSSLARRAAREAIESGRAWPAVRYGTRAVLLSLLGASEEDRRHDRNIGQNVLGKTKRTF